MGRILFGDGVGPSGRATYWIYVSYFITIISRILQLTNRELEQSQDLLIFGSDSDDSADHLVDDEDSNAEDFYQNDYPDSDESVISADLISLDEQLEDLHLDTNSVVWSDVE